MKTQRGELGSRIKGRLVMSWTLGTCGEGGGKGGGDGKHKQNIRSAGGQMIRSLK